MSTNELKEQKEPKYLLDHRELVELLLKKHGVHEGIWGLYVEFKFMVANIGPPGEVLPAIVNAVSKVGLQPFAEESNATFDAAKLNPPKRQLKKDARKRIGQKV